MRTGGQTAVDSGANRLKPSALGQALRCAVGECLQWRLGMVIKFPVEEAHLLIVPRRNARIPLPAS
jgi:hypothetical protein